MIRQPLIWGVGLLTSVALHGAGGALLLWSVEPDPVTGQPVPETRMQLAAQQVRQSTAVETEPHSEPTQTQDSAGTRLDQDAIPQSSAAPAALPQQVAKTALPNPVPLEAQSDTAERINARTAEWDKLKEAKPSSQPIRASRATPVTLASAVLPANEVDASVAPAQAVAALQTQPVALTQTVPDIPKAKASDVFSATGDGSIDPVSLAAFQSFMRPEDAGVAAQDLRDGIDGLLSQVPCARLQVQFQPASNTLDLIGHIPEDGLRAPVLQALQAQMGENIRVTDNLLVLPRPQCGALSGIADVGLPQSTDQITNPLLVGEDVHARAFRYTRGQQLVLDLTGADYDAYVYVDYFDADGQVIHLSPNASTPLTLTDAKSALRIGAENPGDTGLFITIGPPYGQEIAVAFASSAPLYQEPRPLVEPAEPYLLFMKDRVAAARAQDPDFKGEWVYFFITTAEN